MMLFAAFRTLFCISLVSGLGEGNSCVGSCGDGVDHSKPCQCNQPCVNWGDCCDDYEEVCLGGTDGTAFDIIFQDLWDSDVNRLSIDSIPADLVINKQGQTSSSSSEDAAQDPLFSYLNTIAVTDRPTFAAFQTLLDNYNINTGETEDLNDAEWQEINHFMDEIFKTDIMVKTYQFLKNRGTVSGDEQFRNLMQELWFNLYPRSSSGPVDSSGFEHVFVGEMKTSSVTGFHSWLQFYIEESNGNINYQGYVRDAPNIIGARFTWHSKTKSLGSFFVGTSPEFDMAVFSICAIVKPNSMCNFGLNGQSVSIQTYDISHKTGSQIATAYPAL